MHILIFLLSSLGSSLSYVVSKKLSLEYSLIYILLGRYIFSFLILLVFSHYMRLSYIKNISYWRGILVLCLLEVVFFGAFFLYGIPKVSLSQANIILALVPIASCFISIKFLDKARVTIYGWLSVLCGFVACLLLSLDHLMIDDVSIIPFMSIILAAIVWLMAMVYFKIRNFQQPVLMIVRDIHLVSCVIFLIILAYFYSSADEILPSINRSFLLISLGGAGFSTLGYVGYTFLLKKYGIIMASFTSYLLPFLAIIWGYVFFHEPLTLIMLISFFFLIVGLYWSHFMSRD